MLGGASFEHARRAARVLRRQRASALLVISALSLGAAATITLFAFVSAVFVEPLPYPDSAALVRLHEDHADVPARRVSYPNFLDWRRANRSFEAMAAFRDARMTFGVGDRVRAVDAAQVTADYFRVLGIRPRLGRAFASAEDTFGAPLVAVVSDALWRSELGGRADAIGAEVLIDGEAHVIVGVAPPVPLAPGDPDLWVLSGQRAAPGSAWTQRDNRIAGYVLARLRPGVDVAEAEADMQRIGRELAREFPLNAGHTIRVVPLREALYGDLRLPVAVSFGAVIVLLLIVCVNASSLLLIRAAERRPELALRAALGADRRHIVLEIVGESALLAAIGTAVGLALAAAALELIAANVPPELLRGVAPRIGMPAAAFSVALMVAVGIVTGVPPALRAASQDFAAALGAGSRASAPPGRARDLLVVLETALALALLVCAALLVESVARIQRFDHGFDPRGVLTFRVLIEDAAGGRDELIRAHARLLESLERVPGVRSAAIVQELPGLEPRWQTDINPDSDVGRPASGVLINVDWSIVSADYFDALRIPLVAGRRITAQEARDGAPVMVIDESLARRFWPGGGALGRSIRYDGPQPVEIVGVAADVRTVGRQDPGRIKIYTPYGRFPLRDMAVVVRADGVDPASLAPRVRTALRAADPGIAIFDVGTLREELGAYLAPRTLTALVLGLFAAFATGLAALGVYAVVSHAALRRRRELAVRVALGARSSDILLMLLGKGVATMSAGIVLGLVAGASASRAVAGLLFGVSATSPATYLLAALLFSIPSLAACAAPAWRARAPNAALVTRGE